MLLKLLARPKRFELLTPRFVVWCSIQLSYGRLGRLRGRDREPKQARALAAFDEAGKSAVKRNVQPRPGRLAQSGAGR